MTVRSTGIWSQLVGLAVLYAATYVALPFSGRYEPSVWGLMGRKEYNWAPFGFVNEDTRWRMPMIYIFLPFLEADRFFWHTSDLVDSGKYPAHVVESTTNA